MTNPLLQTWQTPFGMPPFESIQASHFEEAFDKALLQHQAEIAAISNNSESPTFENTLIALEASGDLLNQTSNVFSTSAPPTARLTFKALKEILRPNWQRTVPRCT